MSEIKQIIAQVNGPQPETGYPGRVMYGFYVIDDGVLTMTDEAGVPVRDKGGDIVRHKLEDGQDEQSIARVLTLRIWRQRTGGDGNGFNRPLNYPRTGVA
jgi:hypothetical protein